ncbi:hypothetical protein [Caballeronia sp. J97]|uniref:lysozyme inhibitor LprI family protein n=1 Tax=Caballeronia sp. J97 TaxID=2805429 RepID=UPI002AAF6AA5|nr:hypothetical protein [Caballeronia sp. J97]
MNSGKKLHNPSIDLRRCARVAACALLTSLGAISASHAASFHCPRNASASERLVCSDPELSSLDDKLAVAFRAAHDAASDAAALDADRVTQWQWRQRNCKDKACVADWYTRRIAELEADVEHGRTQTVNKIKSGVAEQQLAPSAEAAVFRLKGLAAAKDEQTSAVPDVPAEIEKGAPPVPARPSALQTGSTTESGPTRAVLGQAGVEHLRSVSPARYETAAAAPVLNTAAAPHSALTGSGTTSCKTDCAQRQVRIAF